MATTTNNGWETPDDTDLVKDGALAIRTLGNNIDTSTGKGLIAWQTWAPTLGSGWLNGNGTWLARYCLIGKTVHMTAEFTIGSTTTKGTILTISLPVTAQASAQGHAPSITHYSCAGTLGFALTYINSTTTAIMRSVNVGAGTFPTLTSVTATVPGTWATGDSIQFAMTYEAA